MIAVGLQIMSTDTCRLKTEMSMSTGSIKSSHNWHSGTKCL